MKINISIKSTHIMWLALLCLLTGNHFQNNFLISSALVLGWLIVAVNAFLITLCIKYNAKDFFKFDYRSLKERLTDTSLVVILFAVASNMLYEWKYLPVILLLSTFILGKFEYTFKKQK